MKLPLFMLLSLFAATLSAAPAAPISTVVVSAAKPSSHSPGGKQIVAKPGVAGSAVDLNAADASTLAREMRGIGESKAKAIVEYRRIHGPFRSIDDLALVKGIGARTIDMNRAKLRVGAAKPTRNATQ